MEVKGQLHASAARPRRKEPLILTEYEAGWAPEPVWALWRREKYPTHVENWTPANQPVAIPTGLSRLSEYVYRSFIQFDLFGIEKTLFHFHVTEIL
jgi:hypothetical protein